MQGNGTSGDPFIITTAEELYNIRDGGTNPGTTATYYQQGNNIYIPPELSDIWCLGTEGDRRYTFHTYNGGRYKVSGLIFKEISVNYVGLFPSIINGRIINLGVECDLAGGDNVGGICGSLSSNNTSISIANCYSTGNISGVDNVGGICGNSTSNAPNTGNTVSIANCYSTGNISGVNNVGGICGSDFASGGGSTRRAIVNIANCYSTGNISGVNNVGGIRGMGRGGGSVSSTARVSIDNCYSTGNISGVNNVGGIWGNSSNSTTSGMNSITNCVAINQKIIRTSYSLYETFGRIIGNPTRINLSNNYALYTMLFYPNGDV